MTLSADSPISLYVICTVETGYKNIPVIRTCFSTPDDVLITGFHCVYI